MIKQAFKFEVKHLLKPLETDLTYCLKCLPKSCHLTKKKIRSVVLSVEFDAQKLSLWDFALKKYFLLLGQFPQLLLQMGELTSRRKQCVHHQQGEKTFCKRVICCRKANLLKEKEEEREEGGFACGNKDLILIILKNNGETLESLKSPFSSCSPKPIEFLQTWVWFIEWTKAVNASKSVPLFPREKPHQDVVTLEIFPISPRRIPPSWHRAWLVGPDRRTGLLKHPVHYHITHLPASHAVVPPLSCMQVSSPLYHPHMSRNNAMLSF